MTLRVLIVDDEPTARLGVSARLLRHQDFQAVGECASIEEVEEALKRLKPDLIFLDVRMPGISGISWARAKRTTAAPMIVFLTAHEEYALDAFDVEALDYLLKPVDDDRFNASLDRARRLYDLRRSCDPGLLDAGWQRQSATQTFLRHFSVRVGGKVNVLPVDDVEWVEGFGDYAGLHVGDRTLLIRATMTSLETRLDPAKFVRLHRSTIVRTNTIRAVKAIGNRDYLVQLSSGTMVRASRSYSGAVRSFLGNVPNEVVHQR